LSWLLSWNSDTTQIKQDEVRPIEPPAIHGQATNVDVDGPKDGKAKQTKPFKRGYKLCYGALVPLYAEVGGMGAAGKDWCPTSHTYFTVTTNLTKISLSHACSGDALKSLVYFGKGTPVLVIDTYALVPDDRVSFPLTRHPTRPDVWFLDTRTFMIKLVGRCPALVIECSDASTNDEHCIVWEEILAGCDIRNQIIEKKADLVIRPFFPNTGIHPCILDFQATLDCGNLLSKAFDPTTSRGTLTVDFDRDFKDANAVIDALAFKPTQVPFRFIINGSDRVWVNEDLLEAIMAQTLTPSAYYDPILDVCYLKLGVLHMEQYVELLFRKD